MSEPPQLNDEPNGLYFDRLGVAISQREWVSLREGDEEYYRIGSTTVGDIWVSTVWVGLDMGFSFVHPDRVYEPIIFETMVFNNAANPDDRFMDLEMERYSTEAQARDGHERMVGIVMALEMTEDRSDT